MSDETNVPKPGRYLHCSFCAKDQREVERLIAGPSVTICNECIDQCNELLAEKRRPEALRALDELVGALDEQLVGHREQKRIVAARLLDQARVGPGSRRDETRSIVLVGPRGVGKSFLVERASALVGLPVVVVDAARSIGWEGVFDELVRKAAKRKDADTGVICIEHVDRIIGLTDPGQAIQSAILEVMNGTMIPLTPPARNWPHRFLDTTRLQLVFTFTLDGAPRPERGDQERPSWGPRHGNPLRIQARDLIERGMMPELADRMGVLCSFEPLSATALEAILRRVDGPLKRHLDRLQGHGMTVSFTDDAIARLAAAAANGDAGARGLSHALEAVASAIHCTVDASAGDFVVEGSFVDECLPRS